MELENIKIKSDKLIAEMQLTTERRLEWNQKTKELIYNTLTKIKSETRLAWSVQKIDEIKNQEFVNIHLNARPSGIVETERLDSKVTSKVYSIESGYLTFTQSVNGKIYSIISYPFVQDIIPPMEVLPLGLFDPNEITENLIVQHVEMFLDEMIKWQSNYPKVPIGFKI